MNRAGRRSRQRGISMILVIILVVLTAVLFSAVVLIAGEKAATEEAQARLKAEIVRLDAERAEWVHRINPAVTPTGFPAPKAEGEPPTADAMKRYEDARKTYLVDRVLKIADDLKQKAQEQKIPPPKLKREQVEIALKELPLHESLQEIVPLVASELDRERIRLQQKEEERKLWTARVQAARDTTPEIDRTKGAFKTDVEAKRAALNAQIAEEEAAHNARKAELESKMAEARQLIDTESLAAEKEQTHLRNQISTQESKLEELRQKEVLKHDISISYGKVLAPDVANRSAFIDLGSRSRIVPGLKFLVARRGKQGRFEYKGEIEVKKVHETHSEVSITRVFEHDLPIIDGDAIVNPLYHPRRPVVVAFAGERGREMRLRIKFGSVQEASNRIREMGGEVRDSVEPEVDFVIRTELGDSSVTGKTKWEEYPEYQKALLLEIPMAWAVRPSGADANEPGIFDFLGD